MKHGKPYASNKDILRRIRHFTLIRKSQTTHDKKVPSNTWKVLPPFIRSNRISVMPKVPLNFHL